MVRGYLLRKNKDRLNAFRVAESKIDYLKSDVYCLGMMILRMFNLYTNDNFYDFSGSNTFAKINTKKLEKTLLSIHQIYSQFACLINQMIIYDYNERPSFIDLDKMLEHQDNIVLSSGQISPCRIMPSSNENNVFIEDISPTPINQKSNSSYNLNRQPQTSKTKNPSPMAPPSPYMESTLPLGHERTASKSKTGNSYTPDKSTNDNIGELSKAQKRKIMGVLSENNPLIELEDGNLFREKGLEKFKSSVIVKLEKAIFFDESGDIRKGLKVKDYMSGGKYIGEMFCGKRDGFGLYYYPSGDIF